MRLFLVFGLILAVVAGCGGSNSPPKPPVAICSAFLQWIVPTERMDDTPLPRSELKAFTIYVSQSPDPRDMLIELVVAIEDVNLISWEIRNLTETQHFFWVTVTDTEDRESAPSNIEDKTC